MGKSVSWRTLTIFFFVIFIPGYSKWFNVQNFLGSSFADFVHVALFRVLFIPFCIWMKQETTTRMLLFMCEEDSFRSLILAIVWIIIRKKRQIERTPHCLEFHHSRFLLPCVLCLTLLFCLFFLFHSHFHFHLAWSCGGSSVSLHFVIIAIAHSARKPDSHYNRTESCAHAYL